jgi:hypothetical protein
MMSTAHEPRSLGADAMPADPRRQLAITRLQRKRREVERLMR